MKCSNLAKYIAFLFVGIIISLGMIHGQLQELPREKVLGFQVPSDVIFGNGKVGVTNALSLALQRLHLPGGIVESPGFDIELDKNLLRGTSLRDLLNAIIDVAPAFQWSVEDGVVNLIPIKNQPLLDLKIDRFDVSNVFYATDALNELLAKSTVRKRIVELHLNTGLDAYVGPAGRKEKKPFSVHCKNVTLREALNAIVRSQGHGVWVYREIHWKNSHGFSLHIYGT